MKSSAQIIFCILILMVGVISVSGCKFVFSESEYLGVYPGDFESVTPVFTSCEGHVNIIDVGDNLVNLELVTDSNPTFYYSNLTVERGNFFNSEYLTIRGLGAAYDEDIRVYINRTNHHI